jgi:hypothetical protein
LKVRGNMPVLDEQLPPALEIDDFAANPKLAQLIPVNLAVRYRSLPIAECEGCITVVMADPGDAEALEKIRRAIGRPMKVVRGEDSMIDSLLAELWPGLTHRSLHLEVLLFNHGDTSLVTYGRALGEWLQADEIHVDFMPSHRREQKALLRSSATFDLVVTGDPGNLSLSGRKNQSDTCVVASYLKTSFLLARQPRWPIRTIKCIVRGQPADLDAVRWVARLAHSSGCAVELIALIPPVPLMYAGMEGMSVSLQEILDGGSPLGKHLRRALGYLSNWEVNAKLRMIPGYSLLQIETELSTNQPDLVVVPAQEPGISTWLLQDELMQMFVARCETSLLVAKCHHTIQRGSDA